MGPMDEPDRHPLPWEQKGVLGALTLRSLQSTHEGILLCAGFRAPGYPRLQSGFAVLLAFYLLVGVGLWMRSRFAWWLGVIVIGGFGLLHLATSWDHVTATFQHEERIATLIEYEWIGGFPPGRFGMFWTISRSVLLLCVPALLLLGRLRIALRPR